jgi:gluconate 2-dehydrogenase gamma chain
VALGACRRLRRRIPKTQSCAEVFRTGSGRVLDKEQWAALEAACARIIPSEKGEPGAAEAAVVNYIDGQLSLSHFKFIQKIFFAGLRKMDLLAKQLGSSGFAALSVEKQDQVLRRLERGVQLSRRRNSKRFFRLLLTFTIEGFLCDPVYGGNRELAGWRFIGFTPRPPRPTCPYRGPV